MKNKSKLGTLAVIVIAMGFILSAIVITLPEMDYRKWTVIGSQTVDDPDLGENSGICGFYVFDTGSTYTSNLTSGTSGYQAGGTAINATELDIPYDTAVDLILWGRFNNTDSSLDVQFTIANTTWVGNITGSTPPDHTYVTATSATFIWVNFVWDNSDAGYTVNMNQKDIPIDNLNISVSQLKFNLDVTYGFSNGAWGIFVDATYVYMACYTNGLKVYTFDGTTFTLVDSQDDGNAYTGVWSDGTYIYTACGSGGLRVYELVGGSLSLLDANRIGDCWNVHSNNGTYIYTAEKSGGIAVYSFDGISLTLLDSRNDGSNVYMDVWHDGNYLYAADEIGGNNIRAYSFNGSNFTLIDTMPIVPGMFYSVWGDGTYIYTAADDHIGAYSFDGSSFTFLDSHYDSGQYWWVWGDGSFIYITCTTSGIRVYSFDGSSFTLEYSRDDGGSYRNVHANADYIYVPYNGGIRTYILELEGGELDIWNITLSDTSILSCSFTYTVNGGIVTLTPIVSEEATQYRWTFMDETGVKGQTSWIDIEDIGNYIQGYSYPTSVRVAISARNTGYYLYANYSYLITITKTSITEPTIPEEIPTPEPTNIFKDIRNWVEGRNSGELLFMVVISILIFLGVMKKKYPQKKIIYPVLKNRRKKKE